MLRRKMMTVGYLLAIGLANLSGQVLGSDKPAAGPLSPDQARQLAIDAYIYGYPLVTMEWTRRVSTNVAKPEGTRAPMGNLIKLRQYPDAKFRDVTAPNADTLYTTAWIDVTEEPWVLKLPDSKGRYYLMPMLDGWTNVFQVPGKRTTGDKAQAYAITGPRWQGKIPDGVVEYKSPTGMVWILGRIYCTGTPEDYAATHAMQDEVSLVPLSAYGKAFTPPAGKVDTTIDMKMAVRDHVNGMDTESYFKLLAKLMKDNPPAAADAPMVANMARLGIVPGSDFKLADLGTEVGAALKDVPKVGFERIMGYFKEAGKHENGWVFTTQTGIYGTNYVNRALITAIGLGANRPEDAVYPTSEIDAEGKPYQGENKYVIHFDKGKMPPADAFWSLTMYDDKYFFVDNRLNRYNVSSRSKFLENKDGSVDVYVQHESPGADKETNWLPAPEGRFILMLRLYWPRATAPSILDGSWTMPAVQPLK